MTGDERGAPKQKANERTQNTRDSMAARALAVGVNTASGNALSSAPRPTRGS
jgi:hypothetical protein